MRVVRHPPGLVIALLFLGVAAAGCVGDDAVGPEEPEDVAEAPAEVVVTNTLGAIKGSLTSDLFEPLSGGRVTIVETGRETKVARNGHFTFNDVEPGTYVLHFSKDGYQEAQRQVPVAAGEVAEVFVQLVPAAGEEPWTELLEISGQVTQDVSWHVAPTGECMAVPAGELTVRSCAGSSGNPVYAIHRLNITEEIETMLLEATWNAAGPLGEHLRFYALCPTYSDDRGAEYEGDPCYIEAPGSRSPLIIRVDQAIDGEVIEYVGDWYVRIMGGSGLVGTKDLIGVDVGVSYEQRFTLFFSFFHGAPAPDGYSALPDQ